LPTMEERVTLLEVRMDEQERLRASQDSDLSDLGLKLVAQQKLIQAIAKTQSDHTAILAEHTQRLGRLEGKVDNLQGGVEQIIGVLDTLIQRGDRQ
jgi:uncharacterized coiled-coil protein SlyX